jgi:RHO1 GDP-GTP exchange protein 1/2
MCNLAEGIRSPYVRTIAFQYPYVLAFEPTFVEIRNVETGAMSQVIQGNNLRCLYTDAPASLQHAYSRHSHGSFSSYSTSGGFAPGNALFSPAVQGYSNGRASLPIAYGQSPVPPYPVQPPTSAYGQAAGREEVILVSDDRVLALRMTALPGQ